jgi:hypothetical protein
LLTIGYKQKQILGDVVMNKKLLCFVTILVMLSSGISTNAQVATNGLNLHMDAAIAGATPSVNWEPLVGKPGGGLLVSKGDVDGPKIRNEAAADKFIWYYSFTNPTPRTGQACIGDLTDVSDPNLGVHFDYDADFTVEAWVRVTGPGSWSGGRGTIFGSQGNATGYRVGIRDNGGGQYKFEVVMRDVTEPCTGQWSSRVGPARDYSATEWVHMVFLYDGLAGATPLWDLWVNGAQEVDGYLPGPGPICGGAGEPHYVPDGSHANIGGNSWNDPDQFNKGFNGDVSIVRVYNRLLSDAEVTDNRAVGLTLADEAFISGEISEEDLNLYLDASDAGADTDNHWTPLIGKTDVSGGVLGHQTDPAAGAIDNTPVLLVEPAGGETLGPDSHNWYYRFTTTDADAPTHYGGGGFVRELKDSLGTDLLLSYNKDYSVEVWFRSANPSPWDPFGKGILFSTMIDSANGYRLNVRNTGNDPASGQFYIESYLRDNKDSVKTKLWKNSLDHPRSATDWYHVVATVDGETDQRPEMNVYINGALDAGGTADCAGTCDDYSDPDYTQSHFYVWVGARADKAGDPPNRLYDPADRLWFDGDIAIVRVYTRVLSPAEVANNFNVGFAAAFGSQCIPTNPFDVDGNCVINVVDLAGVSADWLSCTIIPPSSCP